MKSSLSMCRVHVTSPSRLRAPKPLVVAFGGVPRDVDRHCRHGAAQHRDALDHQGLARRSILGELDRTGLRADHSITLSSLWQTLRCSRGRQAVSRWVRFVFGKFLCCRDGTSAVQLIFFRAMQAAGSALIMANNFALVTALFPREERGRAMGIAGGTVSALGYTIGPVLGGLLTHSFGWRANFFVSRSSPFSDLSRPECFCRRRVSNPATRKKHHLISPARCSSRAGFLLLLFSFAHGAEEELAIAAGDYRFARRRRAGVFLSVWRNVQLLLCSI